jgi:hypothetical protein
MVSLYPRKKTIATKNQKKDEKIFKKGLAFFDIVCYHI